MHGQNDHIGREAVAGERRGNSDDRPQGVTMRHSVTISAHLGSVNATVLSWEGPTRAERMGSAIRSGCPRGT